ncbi:hypothetical protein [Actinophytocola gossypii]|uniref:Uncharacterized protein n=1 Tax=Actinophytocola gossypii TaxID=2812003 RepID=A0ABT2JJT2_9PSEU|nr:hypothetical protein [Actinophytocola gossypii]MCT2587779.1 hypothetical protein [Actinophytocola gossypii]
MTTTTTTTTTTATTTRAGRVRPRVWLAAGLGATPDPVDWPRVRDDLMRRWEPGLDGLWHTADGRHHATWAELHARFDLVEV